MVSIQGQIYRGHSKCPKKGNQTCAGVGAPTLNTYILCKLLASMSLLVAAAISPSQSPSIRP